MTKMRRDGHLNEMTRGKDITNSAVPVQIDLLHESLELLRRRLLAHLLHGVL
jgi:hypothetical protein